MLLDGRGLNADPGAEPTDADQQATDGLLYTRATTAGVRPESREVDVIASTDVLDSHGTILRQNWQLERFEQNPIVLWGHNYSEVPIGRAPKVSVKGSKKNGQRNASMVAESPDLIGTSGEGSLAARLQGWSSKNR